MFQIVFNPDEIDPTVVPLPVGLTRVGYPPFMPNSFALRMAVCA